jgi:hypothetical protein
MFYGVDSWTLNPLVEGSIPSRPTKDSRGWSTAVIAACRWPLYVSAVVLQTSAANDLIRRPGDQFQSALTSNRRRTRWR